MASALVQEQHSIVSVQCFALKASWKASTPQQTLRFAITMLCNKATTAIQTGRNTIQIIHVEFPVIFGRICISCTIRMELEFDNQGTFHICVFEKGAIHAIDGAHNFFWHVYVYRIPSSAPEPQECTCTLTCWDSKSEFSGCMKWLGVRNCFFWGSEMSHFGDDIWESHYFCGTSRIFCNFSFEKLSLGSGIPVAPQPIAPLSAGQITATKSKGGPILPENDNNCVDNQTTTF